MVAGGGRCDEKTRTTTSRTGRARGTNTVIVSLVEWTFSPDPPRNAYGVDPFTTPGDLGTPNPAYFEHVDWLVERAADLGILVLAVPCYLGYPNPGRSHFNPDAQAEGWYDEVLEERRRRVRGLRPFSRRALCEGRQYPLDDRGRPEPR